MQRSASIQVCVETAQPEIEENGQPACPDTVSLNEPNEMERLFPDPQVRELLQEIAGDLRRVARFVKRIDKELKTEKEFSSETDPSEWD